MRSAVWRPFIMASLLATSVACEPPTLEDAPVEQPPGTTGTELGFDNDNRTDLTVWRPSSAQWFTIYSTGASSGGPIHGQNGDVPVAGDFDGDGRMDRTVWRPSNGYWYVRNGVSGAVTSQQWGTRGDTPLSGDFDGDAKSDFAVWRPINSYGQAYGQLFVILSATREYKTINYGPSNGELPVSGDYNGDGKTDFALWRPADGLWTILDNSTGTRTSTQFGQRGDTPVSGDFDGDSKSDLAVWRSGVYYILQSSTGTVSSVAWGSSGDVIVPGDFDGDDLYDYAVWKPSNGTWYIKYSSNIASTTRQWGTSGDVPVGEPFIGRPRARLMPNARVVDSQARSQMQSFDPASGTVSFASGATNFQVGDIIVSEPTALAPYGIPPIKVTSRSESNGRTIYETTPSSLDEVLDEAEIDLTREISVSDLEEVDEYGNPLPATLTAGTKLCKIAGIGITCEFSVPNADSPVKLTGSFEFKAKQQFTLKFRKVLRIKEFKVAVGVEEKARLALEYNHDEDLFQFEVPIGQWRIKRWVVFIGPVPVTIEMYVKFKVGADGKVSLATEYSINQSASVLYGFRYTHDHGWENINEKTFDLSIKDPSSTGLNVNGEVRGYLAAVPGVGIYAPAKVVGAESDIGSIKAYGKLKVQYPAYPLWRFSAGLEFCAGLSLKLKLNLGIIKRDFEFKVLSEGKCSDLELWHKEGGGTADSNLAQGAFVSASSSVVNPSAGWLLANVHDGKRNSVLGDSLGWASGGWSDPNHVEWLQFDLGSSAILSKIDLYPRNDQTYGSVVGDGFPVDFTIDVSNDGTYWQTVVWRSGYPTPLDEVQSFPVSVASARYVRIQATRLDAVTGTYYVQLAEVEIHGRY